MLVLRDENKLVGVQSGSVELRQAGLLDESSSPANSSLFGCRLKQSSNARRTISRSDFGGSFTSLCAREPACLNTNGLFSRFNACNRVVDGLVEASTVVQNLEPSSGR